MAKLSYGQGTAVTEGAQRGGGYMPGERASRELQSLLTGMVRKLNAGHDVEAVSSANASDLATAITLVNEIKTKLNLIIAAMKA